MCNKNRSVVHIYLFLSQKISPVISPNYIIMRFYQLNHFILASTSAETQNAALKKKKLTNQPNYLFSGLTERLLAISAVWFNLLLLWLGKIDHRWNNFIPSSLVTHFISVHLALLPSMNLTRWPSYNYLLSHHHQASTNSRLCNSRLPKMGRRNGDKLCQCLTKWP